VPQLFTDAWNRLAPILKQAIRGATQSTANQYTSFIRAMDAASSFSGIGQRLGIFRITPDALRSAAGLIGAGGGDPLAYTAEIDAGLRALLGFTGTLPMPIRRRFWSKADWSACSTKHRRPCAGFRSALRTRQMPTSTD
jgi:hypothetical protein